MYSKENALKDGWFKPSNPEKADCSIVYKTAKKILETTESEFGKDICSDIIIMSKEPIENMLELGEDLLGTSEYFLECCREGTSSEDKRLAKQEAQRILDKELKPYYKDLESNIPIINYYGHFGLIHPFSVNRYFRLLTLFSEVIDNLDQI